MMVMIVAMAENGVIGNENRLPWHLPADLKHFRTLTWGHPIVMGRKTYESIGKPLPGRENIVLTRDPSFSVEGVMVCHDLNQIIRRTAEETLYIIGGSELYAQCLVSADRIHITRIGQSFEGDAFFPHMDDSTWKLLKRTDGVVDASNTLPHTFEEWARVREEAYID